MRRTRQQPRGFTLIELVIVVAIIGVVTGLAVTTLGAARPRQTFVNAVAELQTIVHGARQQALARGNDVAVLVFPSFVNPLGGRGRVVVVEDRDAVLFSTASATNLDNYKPESPFVPEPFPQDTTTFDLPPGIVITPVAGAALAAPLNDIAAPKACTFCSAGGTGPGAIRFDTRGRASFYAAAGPALATTTGQIIALAPADTQAPTRYLYVTSATGAVMVAQFAD